MPRPPNTTVPLATLVALLAIPLTGLFQPIAVPRIQNRQSPRFNLNRDPPGALVALPGLGPVIVGDLIRAREESPFLDLRDVDRRVRGIGPARAREIAPFVEFAPPVAHSEHP